MLCLVCHDKQSPTTLPSITTAQASANVYDDSTALPINQPDILTFKERVQTNQEVRDNARAAYERLQAAQAMTFAADVEEEEDLLIPGDHPSETCNKGGCPIGLTIKHSQAQELAQKQAINYVVIKYATRLEGREETGKKRLETGIREKLVKRAIKMFVIEGKLDVPKQTIYCPIALERLEIWHLGTESSLLEVEVVLISFLFTAHRLCCPLSVGDTIVLMNALISGTTSHEKQLIAWKKTHSCYNIDSPPVGHK